MSIPKLHSLLLLFLLLFLQPFHAISQYTTIQNDKNILPPFISDHHKDLPRPDLHYNYITGNFPTVFFYNRTNHQYLHHSENYFLGNILDHISRWSLELQNSSLFGNNLAGDFPVISRLSKLPPLQQRSGYLNNIPDGLSKVSSLETLIMSDNSFARELPQKLATKVSILQKSNKTFSGQRPTGVCFLTSHRDFRATNDLFNGGNRKDLTSLQNLATILLDGNKLSSALLAAVASCSSLNTLNLSRKQVTGQIPEGLGLLKVLTVLDLSRNNVSGPIRGEVGRQLVSANTVTRTIPSQLDSHAFKRSFWENPALCSDNPLAGLVSCRARSHAGPSSKISFKSVSIAAIMIWLMVFGQKSKDLKWKLTPFDDKPLPPHISTVLNFVKDKDAPDDRYSINGSKKVYKIPVKQPDGPDGFVVVNKTETTTHFYDRTKKIIIDVEILKMIEHPNIVKPNGHLSKGKSTLLIYDYFEKESLDRWLHKNQNPPGPGLLDHSVLDWPKRLKIAVGIAEGLSHLHHGSRAVVHMNLKLSNILLDIDFIPKIANFRLAKFLVNHRDHKKASPSKGASPSKSTSTSEGASPSKSASTSKGSYGYIGPEYTYAKENMMFDVYQFGVILLQLVTGKVESDTKENNLLLVEWARQQTCDGNKVKPGTLDKDVNEPMYTSYMTYMFYMGLWCTTLKPEKRPCMNEVCRLLVENTTPNGKPNTQTRVSQEIPQGEEEGDMESPTMDNIPNGPQPQPQP